MATTIPGVPPLNEVPLHWFEPEAMPRLVYQRRASACSTLSNLQQTTSISCSCEPQLEELGRPERVEAEIQAVLTTQPRPGDSHALLKFGQLNARFGRWNQAVGFFTKAFTTAPKDFSIDRHIAACAYILEGNLADYKAYCSDLMTKVATIRSSGFS